MSFQSQYNILYKRLMSVVRFISVFTASAMEEETIHLLQLRLIALLDCKVGTQPQHLLYLS